MRHPYPERPSLYWDGSRKQYIFIVLMLCSNWTFGTNVVGAISTCIRRVITSCVLNGSMEFTVKNNPWWRHQLETSSALLAICVGIHRSPVNSPHKGQLRGALIFSLIFVWINGSVNKREAGDFRCYRAHYDVSVMFVREAKCSMGLWWYLVQRILRIQRLVRAHIWLHVMAGI